MSLINQMLRDLDSRHASQSEKGLPFEVRPLPLPDGSSQCRKIAVAGLVLVLALAAAGAWWLQSGRPLPIAPPIALPEPAEKPAQPPIAAGAPKAASPAATIEAPPPAQLPATAAVPAPAPARTDPAAPRAKKTPSPQASGSQGEAALRLAEAITGDVPPSAEPTARKAAAAAAPDAAPARIEKSPHLASARDRAEAEFRKGLERVRQGRSADAIAHFQAALREDPSHVPARNGLLNALLENQRLAEAEEALRQGIALQPVHIPWVVFLARLRIEHSDVTGAWAALQEHLQAGAASADFQGMAGVVLQRLARSKEAVEHYQAAARLAPDNPRWWVGLGVALEAESRADAAREAYRKAKELPGLSPKLAAFVEQRLK